MMKNQIDNINYSLTFKDVKKLRPNTGLLTYDELVSKPLLQVLNSYPDKAVIVLIRQMPTYGHYCTIYLKEDNPEFGIHIFDSYGKGYPDGTQWYRNISASMRQQLGEDAPYLLKRVQETGLELYYNDFPYQSFDKVGGCQVTTCGKWCCLRTALKDLTCDEFRYLIVSLCDELNLQRDELVSLIFRY